MGEWKSRKRVAFFIPPTAKGSACENAESRPQSLLGVLLASSQQQPHVLQLIVARMRSAASGGVRRVRSGHSV
eukprot:367811-Hanusia_phi.AAC.1